MCHGGSSILQLSRADEALALFEQAVALRRAYGAVHRNVASALGELGTAQLGAGNAAEALASFERAVPMWASVAPQHPSYSDALYGRYRARVATGAKADVTDLENALELAKGKPAFQRARIQLELGRTIGGERGAALVKAAIEGFASSPLPLPQRELALARGWEVAHD